MNDDLKFVLGIVFVILVVGIVILGVVGALMYWGAYIETTMIVQ